MIDVDKLMTLRAVLDHGSFSAAAKALHLTQPAVSRQISLLERRLGVELVRRTHQGVYPSEAGRLLATHAGLVRDQLERAEAEVAELAGLRQGTVRLGAFFTAMVHLSAEFAVALGEDHPGLRVIDDLVDRDEAFDKLVRGQLDVAIVSDNDVDTGAIRPGIEFLTLFKDPLRVLLPARHPLGTRRTIRLSDLNAETWIRAHDGSLARLIDDVLRSAGITPQLILAGHGAEPIEAQALVAAGRGITLAYDLNLIIDPEQIIVRPLSGKPPVRHVRAAYLSGHRSTAIAAALDALRRIGRDHRSRM